MRNNKLIQKLCKQVSKLMPTVMQLTICDLLSMMSLIRCTLSFSNCKQRTEVKLNLRTAHQRESRVCRIRTLMRTILSESIIWKPHPRTIKNEWMMWRPTLRKWPKLQRKDWRKPLRRQRVWRKVYVRLTIKLTSCRSKW